MGGSTGRSSSRSFEDPGAGRWDSMSGETGTMDEEEWGLWRAVAPVIYAPDARLSGSHGGVSAEDFSVRRAASKRN